MVSTECVEFLKEVKRHFAYLFDQYGFVVVHCEDAPGGGRHLIVLESEDCRIRFIQNRWDIYVEVGTKASPIGWQDVVEGTKYWYDIGGVLNFLEREALHIDKLLQEQPFLNVEQQLKELARRLRPACEQLIALCRQDVFEGWQHDYHKFQREREEEFRKQYEEWQTGRINS